MALSSAHQKRILRHLDAYAELLDGLPSTIQQHLSNIFEQDDEAKDICTSLQSTLRQLPQQSIISEEGTLQETFNAILHDMDTVHRISETKHVQAESLLQKVDELCVKMDDEIKKMEEEQVNAMQEARKRRRGEFLVVNSSASVSAMNRDKLAASISLVFRYFAFIAFVRKTRSKRRG